MYAMYSGFNTV